MAYNKEDINDQDIFGEFLNFNNFNNDIMNEDFPKHGFDSFDKFNQNDEISMKSINSISEIHKTNNLNKSQMNELQIPTPKKIIRLMNVNNLNFENLKKINLNGKNEINSIKELKPNNQFLSKKKELNPPNTEKVETEIKQQKLLLNRESAKKSRLKRKIYIENLEKEYLILKTEYIKIIEKQKLNKGYPNNSILKHEHFIDDNKINPNLKIGKENVLYEFKKQNEENIQKNNDCMNTQKKIMENILINQIDMMTPINIKLLQHKFLKLNKIDNNDNFQTIKNKTNSNIEMIKELYDINENDIDINKKSKGYKLFEFYSNIATLLNKYEVICTNIDKINSI
jgi:hypothetical protein